MSSVIHHGDWIEVLRTMPDESVNCVVTSPPYWGLRDYGVPGQLGLERTPEEYVAKMVEGFREIRRALRSDGTCWVNLGDSYCSTDKWGGGKNGNTGKHTVDAGGDVPSWACRSKKEPISGVKPKDLVGIPWMVAFALRADGWWLRQDIIWAKPNPMPESVTDRCTKSHEYIFLLTKSERYFYDAEAIKVPIKDTSAARLIQDVESQRGSDRVPGKTNGTMKAVRFGGDKQCPDTRLQSGKEWTPKMAGGGTSYKNGHSGYLDKDGNPLCGIMANKKSVWHITTKGYSEAHFATFPPEIPETCIKAGCPEGGTVLDPFSGAGTTGLVATRLGRNYVGIELNAEYIAMSSNRITGDAPMFNSVEVIT